MAEIMAMNFDFLKNFPRRMKTVGLYALLMTNSAQKLTWKNFGIDNSDQQLVVLFAVLLYLMEQSLKEEDCTMDDIASFLSTLFADAFHEQKTYDECHDLAAFIINTVLSNDGAPMYFHAFDFEKNEEVPIRISYIANRIIYTEGNLRRTSYYLTDDGYSLLLGTLEVENNLKLSIHEMIFQMHLEKQSYDKALDDVKNIFNLMRIQVQKLQEAMTRIRRNALGYEVEEYRKILEEDLDTIESSRNKFEGYRKNVRARANELRSMDATHFTKQEADKLRDLAEIESYLSRAIDEYQRILNGHFDLKSLYSAELEKISAMAAVQRFPLRSELFDKVLDDPDSLNRMLSFLYPLFVRDPAHVFNINQALQPQSVRAAEIQDTSVETEEFDEAEWEEEQKALRREKLQKYEESLTLMLSMLHEKGRVTLFDVKKKTDEEPELLSVLIPSTDIFKEIMVELLRAKYLDINALKEERASYIHEDTGSFELSLMVLQILEKHPEWTNLTEILIYRLQEHTPVDFSDLDSPEGKKTIRCTNVCLRAVGEGNDDL